MFSTGIEHFDIFLWKKLPVGLPHGFVQKVANFFKNVAKTWHFFSITWQKRGIFFICNKKIFISFINNFFTKKHNLINNINIYHFKILQNINEKANIFIKTIKILVKNVNQIKKWHFLKTWQTWQKRGMGSKTLLLQHKSCFVATLVACDDSVVETSFPPNFWKSHFWSEKIFLKSSCFFRTSKVWLHQDFIFLRFTLKLCTNN